MAHSRLTVATVPQTARDGIYDNHTSTAASVSGSTSNASTDMFQISFDHGQDSLFEVQRPPHPSSRSPRRSAAVASFPLRNPVPRTIHDAPRVVRVPPGFVLDEASATKGIENMENSAWGMLSRWPLNAFLKLVGGGRDPEPEEAAPQANTVPVEGMTDDGPPPPYDFAQTW